VIALVTGANRGVGQALTEALLTRGVKKVYATARNVEALHDLRDERIVRLRLDVTDADQVRAIGEAASYVELVFNHAGAVLFSCCSVLHRPSPKTAEVRSSTSPPGPV